MEGPLPCNTFTPTAVKVPGHDSWIHYSCVKLRKKTKRTLNTPVSPWEISDTYSELQMSAILMNTPKIKFLGIRLLRTALKSKHSLASVVLQNRQEIDLLIPEQGGTWAILVMEIWCWLMPQTSPFYTILKQLMIAPRVINWLSCFVSAQVNKLQHAMPVQQGYINYRLPQIISLTLRWTPV